MVPRDDAGEATALRRAGDVDELALAEGGDADHLADLELLQRFGRHRKFKQHDTRLDTRFREVTGLRLGDARRAALPVRDLDGGVAVCLGRLDLRDAIVGDVEDGHRNGFAVVGEHARHANLATDKSE